MHKIKIQSFDGPLDLLLQLIEKEELNISEISLSQVAEQYLAHLKEAKMVPEEMADFLLVAAKLLYIKSKILIPNMVVEEEDGISLDLQLRMYREFLTAAKGIQQIIDQKHFTFARDKMPVVQEVAFRPPPHLTKEKLAMTIRDIIEALRPFLAVPAQAIVKVVSIQEKISRLKELICQKSGLIFSQWVGKTGGRIEVIVSFLALLEMIKQREVSVQQTSLFTEIVIDKI